MRTWNKIRLAVCLMAAMVLVLPAAGGEIDGTWHMVVDTGDETREFPVTIASNGEKVTAKLGEDTVEGTFSGGALKLAGKVYSAQEGYSAPLKLSGTMAGEKLSGDLVWDAYEVTFTATKVE